MSSANHYHLSLALVCLLPEAKMSKEKKALSQVNVLLFVSCKCLLVLEEVARSVSLNNPMT